MWVRVPPILRERLLLIHRGKQPNIELIYMDVQSIGRRPVLETGMGVIPYAGSSPVIQTNAELV